MGRQHWLWRCAARSSAAVVVLATCGVIAFADPPVAKGQSVPGTSNEVLAAWKKAGAEFTLGKGDRLPTFSFDERRKTAFAKLPVPEVPFALEFDESGLTTEDLKELAGLKNLHRLGLENESGLKDAGFAELAQAKELRSLYLGDVALTDTALTEFGKLPKLEELDVWARKSKTSVTVQGLKGLATAPALRTVTFFDVPVDDAALKHLAGLKVLRALRLGGSLTITDEGLKHLAGLTQLEALSLAPHRSPITNAGLKHLAGLKGMTHLSLRYAKVTDDGVLHLAGLKNLRHLDLAATSVSDLGLAYLAGLTELQSLDLRACGNLTPAGLKHLHGLKNLRSLELHRTNMYGEAELKAFREALPNCKLDTESEYTAPMIVP